MIARIFAAALLATVSCATSFAQSTASPDAAIRAAVKKLGPSVSVRSIQKTPIAGLMEVVLSGGQVLYFSPDGNYVMQGSLIEANTRRNLTEAALSGLRQEELKKVAATDMIVFPAKGKVKHTIKVFTDIDCGYCRKLHTEIEQINALGIEVQYLWYPRAGIPSDSSRKAVAIWCAKDKRKALTDAKSRNIDPGNAVCGNPIQKDFDLGVRIGVGNIGTPAIFLDNGTMIAGYLPPAQLLAEVQKLTASKAN